MIRKTTEIETEIEYASIQRILGSLLLWKKRCRCIVSSYDVGMPGADGDPDAGWQLGAVCRRDCVVGMGKLSLFFSQPFQTAKGEPCVPYLLGTHSWMVSLKKKCLSRPQNARLPSLPAMQKHPATSAGEGKAYGVLSLLPTSVFDEGISFADMSLLT